MAERMIIQNKEERLIISDIINNIVEMSRNEENTTIVDVKKTTNNFKKCEICSSIIISIAASALYDLIKLSLRRLKDREDYDPNIKITINNIDVSLKELLDK